ncbi:peroxiredoxin [Defluviimonas sp. WL0050]|uniref:Glutathione-dependent peroxiredoxin n=1 Tax=Albidovulum litorale TaxID=2984134 RepID=A0ABT2ZPF4_9RHOB|nr:peroxiredoxin [Defluviimonas sp. WL0050]MCV2873024.1 peroxiredoxin [Defluviimonas sp. WL0050]
MPLISFDDITALSEDEMKTGSRVPSTPVQQLADGEVRQIDLAARSAGKTMVLVAVPGAFTPTCTDDHVPGYLRDAEAFRDAGVDEIIILATSDFFVVRAWADQFDPPETVQFMADGSQKFARDAGQVLDLMDLGLGLRTQRYAAVIRDERVDWMAIEPDATAVTITASGEVLSHLAR